MISRPETRYARSGDVNIAYQMLGAGPIDLVYVPGFVSNIERIWEHPRLAHFFERLASFSRVIFFDKRGTGLSDRVPPEALPTLEQRMDDVRAVMDAVGSERAALFGHSEGGPMSMLFAATYPQRTTALILYGTYLARGPADYPWSVSEVDKEEGIRRAERSWGSRDYVEWFFARRAPSALNDESEKTWFGAYLRGGASPGAAVALSRMNHAIDVRPIAGSIRVPTLVLCRRGDRSTPIEEARYVASSIPTARLVELPGDDHLFWVGETDQLIDEVQEFLTGARPVPEMDRFLATVLFTDIVGGTQKAAELGDRAWAETVERHHAVIRQQLRRFRGQEVDTAGDGFFATFDGPGRAIRCATAIREAIRPLGLEVRAGLHTGEVQVIDEKVGGVAVITGARIAALANANEVLVSSTVKDLVAGSGIPLADHGSHALKGLPGEWRVFAVA